MQEDLIQRLLTSTGVSAIAGTRINWKRNKQGAANPRIRLRLVSEPRDYHLKGRTGLLYARVQVDCFADSYTQATALRAAVIAELETQSFGSIHLITVLDSGDGPDETPPSPVHHVYVDLQVIHKGA